MSFPTAVNATTIQQWVADKMDVQKVQDELRNSGLDETSIAAHLSAFKKAKYAKRQFTGFMCMAIGAVLGFISCVLTLTNPIPELYYWFLYGLTSVAISVIFIGLYFVFEG
jgi:hypothetical protein